MCCQVGTMVELAGYLPTTPIKDLFPDLAEDEEGLLIQSELKTFIYASKQPFFVYLFIRNPKVNDVTGFFKSCQIYILEKILIFSCTIFDVKRMFHLNCFLK